MPRFVQLGNRRAINLGLVTVIDFNPKGKLVDEDQLTFVPTACLSFADTGQLRLTGDEATNLWALVCDGPKSLAWFERKLEHLLIAVSSLQHRVDRVMAHAEPRDPWPGAEEGPSGFLNHQLAATLKAEVVAELRAAAAKNGGSLYVDETPTTDH